MFGTHNVAITLLFIISTVSALDPKVGVNDSDPVDINNKTVPIPNVTEINKITVPEPAPSNGSDTTTTDPITTSTKPTTSEKTTVTTSTTITTTTTVKPTASTNPTTPTTSKPNGTTTIKPTGAPPTTPIPSHRRFDGPSFIGGIVLALGLVAIGFVAFKFYKARTELNYHTL